MDIAKVKYALNMLDSVGTQHKGDLIVLTVEAPKLLLSDLMCWQASVCVQQLFFKDDEILQKILDKITEVTLQYKKFCAQEMVKGTQAFYLGPHKKCQNWNLMFINAKLVVSRHLFSLVPFLLHSLHMSKSALLFFLVIGGSSLP